MTFSGADPGAHLYELRLAMRITLPEIAGFFAQATRPQHNTRWDERAVFDKGWHAEWELNEHNAGLADDEIFIDNESLGRTATVTEGEIVYPSTEHDTVGEERDVTRLVVGAPR